MSNDDWGTPQAVFEPLNRIFHFELDVCASSQSACCNRYYTKDAHPESAGINGLAQPWAPFSCWCNPPYSDLWPWLEKAAIEADKGAIVVCLLPPWTDRAAWHRWAALADLAVFLQERVAFIDPETGRPQKGTRDGSMLLVYDRWKAFVPYLQRVTKRLPPAVGWHWRNGLPPLPERKE